MFIYVEAIFDKLFHIGSRSFFNVLGGMSHPNKFIIKIIKMKKYIQIANFQLSFFFSNLRIYILSGPEKEGVRVGGLERVEVEVQP